MARFAPNILKTASVGKRSEDDGLMLRITSIGSDGTRHGSWYFKYTFQGKQQEIGLGSIKTTTLAQARDKRIHYAELMSDRNNPVNPKDEKKRLSEELKIASAIPDLRSTTYAAFKARHRELKGDGKAGRWLSPLELHVLPALGDKRVDEIDQNDIKRTLAKLWKDKPPTAKKAIERLRIVLRFARAQGHDANPLAVEDARQLLGATGHVVKHHPALPAQDARRLLQSLDCQNVAQRVLAFYLLSGGGTRILPVRNMTWDQIEGDVWIVPGEIMKGRRGKTDDFRVPLTAELLELIEISRTQALAGDQLVFRSPNGAKEKPISDQAVENIMRAREKDWNWSEPYRLHGLRATFRTWASENNPALYAVAETALAHKVGSSIERSYQRSDFLEDRRELFSEWGAYLMNKKK